MSQIEQWLAIHMYRSIDFNGMKIGFCKHDKYDGVIIYDPITFKRVLIWRKHELERHLG
jgi:hypothetical protein